MVYKIYKTNACYKDDDILQPIVIYGNSRQQVSYFKKDFPKLKVFGAYKETREFTIDIETKQKELLNELIQKNRIVFLSDKELKNYGF